MVRGVMLVLFAVSMALLIGCGRTVTPMDGVYRFVRADFSGESTTSELLSRLSDTERTVVVQDRRLKAYLHGTVLQNVLKVDATKVPAEFDMYSPDGKLLGSPKE